MRTAVEVLTMTLICYWKHDFFSGTLNFCLCKLEMRIHPATGTYLQWLWWWKIANSVWSGYSPLGMLYFSSTIFSECCLYFDIEKQHFGTERHSKMFHNKLLLSVCSLHHVSFSFSQITNYIPGLLLLISSNRCEFQVESGLLLVTVIRY